MSALVLPPPALAGSYTISSYTCTDGRYFMYYAGYNQPVSYGYYGSTSGGAPFSYTLNGTITATYTWSPSFQGDNPPASIVVEEDSIVGYIAPGGTLSTGLTGSNSSQVTGGTVVVGSDQVANGGIVALNAQSSLYTPLEQTRVRTLSNPGTTLTFTCTPSAQAIQTSGYGTIQAAVRYFVFINPPLGIYLKGTTFDTSGQNLLVGQVCTAYVFGIPYGTSATYQWSDPVGTTLTSWTPGLAPVVATWPSGSASPSWYWNDLNGGTVRTVQCVVTVGGTQTTLKQPVNEQVPNITQVAVTPGSVVINVHGPGHDSALYIYAYLGMDVSATFSTPSPFVGPGQMEMVQKVTPSSGYTTSDGKSHPDPNTGATGLDTKYPADSHAEPTFETNDNPNFPLYGYMSSFGLYDTFSDWLLYEPPDAGNGVYFVPRKTYGWQVGTSVSQPSGGWVDTSYASYGNTTITAPPTDTNQYPTWTQVIQGVALPWPASN